MHRTTRMLGILLELQRGATTIGVLAEQFECSRKTIQRDLVAMDELGIPVIRSAGTTGGVSLDPSWSMAPMNLTQEEIETAILALEHATHLPASGQTLAKIRHAARPAWFDTVASNADRPVARTSVPMEMPEIVANLRKVMRREMWCRIDYSGGSNPGWRLLWPEELAILDGRWYLKAVDARSRENRTFRIDRMRDVVPSLAPADADAIVHHARMQPPYQSEQYPEVIVELSERGLQFCRDHHHFHNGLYGDRLIFRCPPEEYRYVAREILRMGTDASIIAPRELIDEAGIVIKELSEHFALDRDRTLS